MNNKNKGNNIVPIILVILIVGLLYIGLNIGKDNVYINKDNTDNNDSNNANDNNDNESYNENDSNNTNNSTNNSSVINIINNSTNNKEMVTIQFYLNGDKEINIVSGFKWTDPGYSAIGSDGKNYNNKVTVTGSVKTSTLGDYTLTYNLNVGTTSKTLTRVVHVRAKQVSLNKISCDKSSYSINVGGNIIIKPSYNPSNTTQMGVTYKSSDTKIATVNTNGKVVGKAKGTITITITSNVNKNIKGTCKVTVKENNSSNGESIKSIKLNKTSLKLEKGKEATLTVTIAPSNAKNKKITWSSDNIAVATVKNGVIKAVGTGKAIITAKTSNGKTATATVTVTSSGKEVAVSKIYLSIDSVNTYLEYASLILNIGETKNVKTVITPSNATNKTITWTSNNPKVVTISKGGKITAIAPGTATITVKSNNGKTTTISVKVPKKTDVLIASDGTINNSYFGIVKNASTSKQAEQTSRGLTAALNYAGMHGIKNVKLSKGTYVCKLVEYREFGRGTLQNGDYNQSCIHITQSNINFDLNGSTLQLMRNDMPKSRLIYIGQATNVSVFNGTLVGDYKNHKCQKGGTWDIINKGGCPNDKSPSHESLHGILMQGVRNVKIRNLTIKEFVGDGITILNPECKKAMCTSSDNKFKYYKSEGVEILNNTIHTTGRNAISIIYGENILIKGNTFHDNKHGIDLEPNDKKELINKITITGNTMYNVRKNTSIALHRAYNVTITKNKLSSVAGARYVPPTGDNPTGGDRRGYKSIDEIYSNIKLSGNTVYKAKEKFLTDSILNKHYTCYVVCYQSSANGMWLNLDKKWYFVDNSTKDFYRNTKATINGKEYTFDANGVCIKGDDC